MKIYTKTGDTGQTGLVGGRINKDSTIINTIGAFDELNSFLGLILSNSNFQDDFYKELIRVQNIIFCIGSIVSGADIECEFKTYTHNLETSIDNMNAQLPELTKFILPGGNNLSANIHVARTVCRRAERMLVEYVNLYESEKPTSMKVDSKKLQLIQKFVNRLSDYLFVLARYVNKRNNVEDIYWNKLID